MPTAAKQHRYPHNRRLAKAHQPPASRKPETYQRPDHHKVYHGRRWRNVSEWYRRQQPFCEACQDRGILKPADLVDHIEPIDQGGEVFDPDNLQALCHACHNRKTAADKAQLLKEANPYLP